MLRKVVLIAGSILLILRLFFPPMFLALEPAGRSYISYYEWHQLKNTKTNIERLKKQFPSLTPLECADMHFSTLGSMRYDYSLALLHALGIAVATGVTLYLVRKRS